MLIKISVTTEIVSHGYWVIITMPDTGIQQASCMFYV